MHKHKKTNTHVHDNTNCFYTQTYRHTDIQTYRHTDIQTYIGGLRFKGDNFPRSVIRQGLVIDELCDEDVAYFARSFITDMCK